MQKKRLPIAGSPERHFVADLLVGLRAVAALQRWAIIITRTVAGSAAAAVTAATSTSASIGRVVSCRAAQRRTVLVVLIVGHLVTVLDRRQPGLHVLKYRRVDNVLRTRRQNRRHFLLGSRDAVGRHRMRSKSFGQCAGLLLLLSLNLLEERDERLRIVACLVHVLHAQEV